METCVTLFLYLLIYPVFPLVLYLGISGVLGATLVCGTRKWRQYVWDERDFHQQQLQLQMGCLFFKWATRQPNNKPIICGWFMLYYAIHCDFDDGYCWVYHCTFRCSSSWLELRGDAQPCAPWAMGKPGEPHMARRELFPASC
jgi:hypothetical protein